MAHEVTDRTISVSDLLRRRYTFLSSNLLHEGGSEYAAILRSGRFHAVEVAEDDDRHEHHRQLPDGTSQGVVHQPIHSSVKLEDLEGAVYAWDDGTAYRFAHCSPAEQIDLAAEVRTFAEAQFAIPIEKARIKVDQTTNAVTKADRFAKLVALVSFAALVGDLAYKAVVGATLGHWHRDPHNDHKRELTVAAIDSAEAAWEEAGKTNKAVREDLRLLNELDAHEGVKTSLGSEHTIEWRAARVARLEAERKAKEAAAEAAAENAGDGAGDGSGD